jgi:hypothetical protein
MKIAEVTRHRSLAMLQVYSRRLDLFRDHVGSSFFVGEGAMSETVDLRALGVLMRQMQGELRALGMKLDLLTKGRERDAASYATRDDLRDIVEVLTGQLAEQDRKLDAVLARLPERPA